MRKNASGTPITQNQRPTSVASLDPSRSDAVPCSCFNFIVLWGQFYDFFLKVKWSQLWRVNDVRRTNEDWDWMWYLLVKLWLILTYFTNNISASNISVNYISKNIIHNKNEGSGYGRIGFEIGWKQQTRKVFFALILTKYDNLKIV